jgi:hypothetical protein
VVWHRKLSLVLHTEISLYQLASAERILMSLKIGMEWSQRFFAII